MTYEYNISTEFYTFAYSNLHFEPGQYRVMYKWQGQGEGYSDYGRAFLAPVSVVFNAGVRSSSYSGTPVGWIAIDQGSQMIQASNWTNQSITVNIDKPSDYKMVFSWYNDSYSGTQPPLAIDDIEIVYLPCFTPVINVDSITSNSGIVRWYIDSDSALVKISSVAIPISALDTTSGDLFDGKLTTPRPSPLHHIHLSM